MACTDKMSQQRTQCAQMSPRTPNQPIGIERIRELVPHAGRMCLLERVVECDSSAIRCETRSHLDPDNPLLRDGHLSSICAIEYAAQAMALHGALNQTAGDNAAVTIARAQRPQPEAPARHGYLASVRDTRCHTPYLDVFDSKLIVSARRLLGESKHVIYAFVVATGQEELVSGRAAVVLG